MPKTGTGMSARPTPNTQRRRPLLNDHDLQTILKGLRLYAEENVYSASDACRLARALVHPERGRRERWIEPRYTLSQFLEEIEGMIQTHHAESRKRREMAERAGVPGTGPRVGIAPD